MESRKAKWGLHQHPPWLYQRAPTWLYLSPQNHRTLSASFSVQSVHLGQLPRGSTDLRIKLESFVVVFPALQDRSYALVTLGFERKKIYMYIFYMSWLRTKSLPQSTLSFLGYKKKKGRKKAEAEAIERLPAEHLGDQCKWKGWGSFHHLMAELAAAISRALFRPALWEASSLTPFLLIIPSNSSHQMRLIRCSSCTQPPSWCTHLMNSSEDKQAEAKNSFLILFTQQSWTL